MGSAERLVIVGADGFGREVLDVLRDIDPAQELWEFAGFVSCDQPDSELLRRIHAPWIGTDDDFLAARSATRFVLATADTRARMHLATRFEATGLQTVTLVRPLATVGSDSSLGSGSIVCAQASITTNVRLGRLVHVDRMASIGHDVRVADFVTLHSASVISGAVSVGIGARLGAASGVLPGLAVGAHVTIGAGALVTASVPDRATVSGVPARQHRRKD